MFKPYISLSLSVESCKNCRVCKNWVGLLCLGKKNEKRERGMKLNERGGGGGGMGAGVCGLCAVFQYS